MTEQPEKITTFEQIAALVEQKKAITITGRGRMPAAFIFKMSAETVWKYIKLGMYAYQKEQK